MALALVAAVGPLLPLIGKHDRSLKDQLRRATQSVGLNIAEAKGHRGGNQRLRLETALGSAYEVKMALRIAASWGYISEAKAQSALKPADSVAAMTYRMVWPR